MAEQGKTSNKEQASLVRYRYPKPAVTPRSLLMVVFRRRKLIALSFAGLFAGVLLAIILLPDQYEAEMNVLVQRERFDPIVSAAARNQPDAQSQLLKLSEQEVNAEVDLMQSQDLLQRVVIACKLEDGLSWWRKMLPGPAQHIFWPDRETRIGMAIQSLQDKLNVVPPNQSNLIKLNYTSSDPQTAANVLQALGNIYLQKHLEVHRPTGTYKFFQEAVDQYRKDLEGVQAKLVEFGKNENLVAAEQEKTNTLEKLSQFDASLETTRAAAAETQHRIEELQRLAQSTPPRRTTQIRTSALLLEQLRSNLFNLNQKRTALLNKYSPTYRAVTDLDKEIAEAQASLAKAESAPTLETTTDGDPTYDWLNSELAKSRSELAGLRARADATQRIVATYRERGQHLQERGIVQQDLLTAVKLAEENYLSAARKQEEVRMSNDLDRSRILNVAIAEKPNVPALPTTSFPVKLALGLFFAGMVSMGLAFGAEYFDQSFRTPDELERYLGVPVLAAIPQSENLKLVNEPSS